MVAPVRIGDVLANKFEVRRILGIGGMGVVVAALHLELDKLVALKFMREELSANEKATERFVREARAAARLNNEHVARVFDVGRLPSGVPYIVMEYLEGHDLAAVLARQGPLPIADAAEYLLQTCEAMADAHSQGIIHRDLKPQNLFLAMRPDGRPFVKVLDFGISKVQFVEAGGPTSTAQGMGSPAYMAPEQMRSARDADARADIWSMGVILYELLGGALPFHGETLPELLLAVLQERPVSLAGIRDGLPAGLLRAVERCLEKDRERRFANVAELAHELVPFAPDRGRAAMSLIERMLSAAAHPQAIVENDDDEFAVPVVPTTLSLASISVESPRSDRRRGRAVMACGVLIAGATFVAGVAGVAGSRDDATPAKARAPIDSIVIAPTDAGFNAALSIDAPVLTVDARIVVDSRVATRPHSFAVDAGRATTTVDAAGVEQLEPARAPEEELQPAR